MGPGHCPGEVWLQGFLTYAPDARPWAIGLWLGDIASKNVLYI